MVKWLSGSRQSPAMRDAGRSTKSRMRNSGWGITSPGSTYGPPFHKMMSRSSTREAHLCPPVRRPKARSVALSRARSSGGASSVWSSAAELAYRRSEGPTGSLSSTGPRAATLTPAASSSSSAAASTSRGRPYRWCGRFEPSAIRYRCVRCPRRCGRRAADAGRGRSPSWRDAWRQPSGRASLPARLYRRHRTLRSGRPTRR